MFLEFAVAIIVLCLTLVMIPYLTHLLSLHKYPPGPFPLPVIGNLHLLAPLPKQRMKELSQIYGDVFSMSFAMQRVVLVNTYEAAKEALIDKGVDFAGRPQDLYTANLTTKCKDIAFADYGPMFRSFRKVGHKSLKMYGEGMIRLETHVIEEVKSLIQRLSEVGGAAIDPLENVANSVINIICYMTFGHKYSFDDEEFKTVIRFNSLFCQGFSAADYIAYFPWMRIFPNSGLAKLHEAMKLRDPFMQKKIEDHRRTLCGDHPRDFLDSVLLEAQKEIKGDSNASNFYTDEHITMLVTDVFTGGGETVVTTIRWALLYLIHYPEEQKKVRLEIHHTIGRSKFVTLTDRDKLPYFSAFLHEVLRVSSIVPLAVPHKTTRDASLLGHPIPVNTQVFINVWALHHDKLYWKDPDIFRPQRWLGVDGQVLVGRKSYLPFSAGRRVCFGESLAKVELFLFLVSLIQRFEISPPENEPLPSFMGIHGAVYEPLPFKVHFRNLESTNGVD